MVVDSSDRKNIPIVKSELNRVLNLEVGLA